MRKWCLYIVLAVCSTAQAWNWWPLPMAEPDTCRDSLSYMVSLSSTAGSGKYNAFWMQSDEEGCQALAPYSGSLRATIIKPATRPNRWYDYDGAVDIIGMAHSALPAPSAYLSSGRFPVYQGAHGSVIVRRLYGHVRLYIIDISAGIMPIRDGMDTPLGTGSLLFSRNAPAMPALRIGLDRWTPIPGLFGYAEIKGGLVHAWLSDNIGVRKAKLHYKWLGVQVGGKLPVNISYELHHAAQWGGYTLEGENLGNNFHAYKLTFLGKSGGNSYNEQYNVLGNHIVSQQLTLTAKGERWHVQAYWQNLAEDILKVIGKGQNLTDGRWGISARQSAWPFINTLTVEYINTTDQSGPYHDQDGIVYSGNDCYYCNSIYTQGWTYYGRVIGTPLITSPLYNDNAAITTLNNRVRACHIGIGGDIYGFRYRVLATHVRNYGRYQYDDWYDMKNNNTAVMLEVNKHVPQAWGLDFGVRLAADFGTQFGNQFSAMISVTKKGLITEW